MKYYLISVFSIFLIVSCSVIQKDSELSELIEITDFFVESLDTKVIHYGRGPKAYENKRETSDRFYRVVPLGRLINVKIQEKVSDEVYFELQEELQEYYKNDKRVNGVYVNKAGTINVDCRN